MEGEGQPGLPILNATEKVWIVVVATVTSTIFRNLQKKSLPCRKRETPNRHYPLWSTVRTSSL